MAFTTTISQNYTINIGGVDIMWRQSDGYIDATTLCALGRKRFETWRRRVYSREYLDALSDDLNIPANELIKRESGTVWAHPMVIFNILRWISIQFDVYISGFIHHVLRQEYLDRQMRMLEP